jgi:hypothetical protein
MKQQKPSVAKQSGMADPDLFVSTAKEKEQVEQIQKTAKAVILECFPDTKRLAQKAESLGVPVLHHEAAFQLKLSLLLLGTQPGFISPLLPRYNELVDTLKKFVPENAHCNFSNGVILLLKDTHNFTWLAYQFYHWLGFQSGLGGYQHEAQKLYETFNRKYHGKLNPQFLECLNTEQAVLLRLAIRRDREALQFIRHVMHEVFVPLNNAKLLEKGEAQA